MDGSRECVHGGRNFAIEGEYGLDTDIGCVGHDKCRDFGMTTLIYTAYTVRAVATYIYEMQLNEGTVSEDHSRQYSDH